MLIRGLFRSHQFRSIGHKKHDNSLRVFFVAPFFLRRWKLDVQRSTFTPDVLNHGLHEFTRMKSMLLNSCSFARFVARSPRISSDLLATKKTTIHGESFLRAFLCFSRLPSSSFGVGSSMFDVHSRCLLPRRYTPEVHAASFALIRAIRGQHVPYGTFI